MLLRRADCHLANSSVVRERIRVAYGIDAPVVSPPHSVTAAPQAALHEVADWAAGGYYLVVSRLLPCKNVHRAVAAFRGLDERLVVVGAGSLAGTLRAQLPENVRLVSGLDDAQMRWAYAHLTALVTPSLEDFGLTPLEAGAFGKPTLALRAGGYLDTVIEGVNGAFFEERTAEAIRTAMVDNKAEVWDSEAIRRRTAAFSQENFRRRLRDETAALWES